jgi:hypothetical protein
MNINKSFTITKSNSFTNSNTHTYTITSTNTNTHTNLPLIEMQLCKGFADNYCQNLLISPSTKIDKHPLIKNTFNKMKIINDFFI